MCRDEGSATEPATRSVPGLREKNMRLLFPLLPTISPQLNFVALWRKYGSC